MSKAKTLEERIAEAVQCGQSEFWDQVMTVFCEVRAGDVEPINKLMLSEYMEHAVETWLRQNTEYYKNRKP